MCEEGQKEDHAFSDLKKKKGNLDSIIMGRLPIPRGNSVSQERVVDRLVLVDPSPALTENSGFSVEILCKGNVFCTES